MLANHKTKAVIFDFDGTIADSFTIFLDALQAVASQAPELTAVAIEDLRKSTTKEIIKKLGIKPWQIPRLIVRGRQEISNRMNQISAFDGMPELLKQLAGQYEIFILSTNSAENIHNFLAKHGLSGTVTKVYGSIGLMGKSASLKKLLVRQKYAPEDCIYVGDETRDIEAAHKTGLSCVAVKWGFNHPDILAAFQPEAMAATPKELGKTLGIR